MLTHRAPQRRDRRHPGPCRGRTVVDQLRRTGREPNADVAIDVDAERLHRPADAAGSARCRDRVPVPAPARGDPAAQRPHRVPRLGAEPGRGRACASAAPSTRSSTPATASTRRRSTPARATTTSSCSTARRCPTRARAGSRTACAGRRGSSTRTRSSGPTATSARPGLHDAVIYELHIGTFSRRGHVRRRDPVPAASWPSSASPRSS